jgi:hypothetical protein
LLLYRRDGPDRLCRGHLIFYDAELDLNSSQNQPPIDKYIPAAEHLVESFDLDFEIIFDDFMEFLL